MIQKRGIILLNIGTPDSPTTSSVRKYLREFLMDPRVLTMPGWVRWILVNLIIAPTRGPKSAHAYKAVWTERGSPLMEHSVACAAKLQAALGNEAVVRVAMRYGFPSIEAVVNELLRDQEVTELVAVPMFPQYSSAATGSAAEELMRVLSRRVAVPALRILPAFYDDPAFISAVAAAAKPTLDLFRPDHVLMSYHGLPENHVVATDHGKVPHCLETSNCCAKICAANRDCYRAQCYSTSRALCVNMGLDEKSYSVSFQSRLGRTPWIKPFTDEYLPELRQRGVKRLAVLCPSFVADCLETVEEIGIRAREQWLSLGGEELTLVPCVNAEDPWIQGLVQMVNRKG